MTGRDKPLRVLAFEPFDAGSHRAVRQSITRHSAHQWTWFTRPGRAWKWRMRLAALELARQAEEAGALEQRFDAVFATSLLSVADLIAALPPARRNTPVLLYMHENQAAYPPGREDPESADRDVHFALTNLSSVLTADLTVFNSRWNRRSFIDGIEALLARAPDSAVGDVAERIRRHSTVIWPPVEPPPDHLIEQCRHRPADRREGRAGILHNPARVVWPHRWEHDKGPDELLALAEAHTGPLNLRWTILGQQFREIPPPLAQFRKRFADRIDHAGFEPDRDSYWQRLAGCDWVLSTARHEFFGIAVVEALLAGCLPWLPNRLSYPELLPGGAGGLSPAHPPADPAAVRATIRAHLQPALASNAVARLDEAIGSLVCGQASPDAPGPRHPAADTEMRSGPDAADEEGGCGGVDRGGQCAT